MMEDEDSRPILDHIVILVSAQTLDDIDSTNLGSAFVISPGGEHANGITYNNLIIFQDGVYIELIAFKNDCSSEARAAHHWGHCKENTIIDWAFTLPHVDRLEELRERVSLARTGLQYQDPWPMGRTKSSGAKLKWFMSFCESSAESPQRKAVTPGVLPFFCLDDTPRSLRVDYVGNVDTIHGCGCPGVSRVKVVVAEDDGFESVEKLYKAMLGVKTKFLIPHKTSLTPAKHTVEIVRAESGEKSRVEVTLLSPYGAGEDEFLPGLIVQREAPDR